MCPLVLASNWLISDSAVRIRTLFEEATEGMAAAVRPRKTGGRGQASMPACGGDRKSDCRLGMAYPRAFCVLSVLSQLLLIASLTFVWLELLISSLLNAADTNPVSRWSKRPHRNYESSYEDVPRSPRTKKSGRACGGPDAFVCLR